MFQRRGDEAVIEWEEALNEAFNMIYQSFNHHGRSLLRDSERHPEHTRELLRRLQRPDTFTQNIVVTGSKGKGSTAYFIARLLESVAPGVGLCTSPHLLDGLERIRVDGAMISESEFLEVFHRIRKPLEDILEKLPDGQYVGPVGIFAVMAAEYYRSRNCTYGVFETGRGALFDDVTRIHHSYAVITSLLMEHVDELGPSLKDIAWHKAGVITPETQLVVLGEDRSELNEAVVERLQVLGTSPQVVVAPRYGWASEAELGTDGIRFGLQWASGRQLNDLTIPNLGRIKDNFALAVCVVEQFLGPLPASVIIEGLAGSRWPGRGEILSQSPFILLDAGVRPESVADMLTHLPRFDQAVLSIPDGKDRTGMMRLVSLHAQELVLTGCTNPRLPYHLDSSQLPINGSIIQDVNQALGTVMASTDSKSRIFLCGTISFVADVYRWLGRQVIP